MVKMKTFNKTVWRSFFQNKGRFIGNSLIVMISLALSSGLASMPSLYQEAYIEENYVSKNVPDIILKNKTEDGFSEEDIEKIKKEEDVKFTLQSMNVDYENGDSIYRIYVHDISSEVGKLTLLDGQYPTST